VSDSTVEDIASVFRTLKPRTGGKGIAVADLAEKTGRGGPAIRADIRRAIQAGLIETDFEHRPSIDGRQMRVPVYRLVKKSKK
jgi:predicted transcriptional regulator